MKFDLLSGLVSLSLLTLSSFGLVGCASGPTYAELQSKLPPIPAGQGRVFVYRTTTLGAAIRPDIKIDDKVVGGSQAKGFIFSDQTAGLHQITVSTEWKHKNQITVPPNQPCFVSTTVTPGLFVAHLIPNQVDNATGEAEIQSCHLTKDD